MFIDPHIEGTEANLDIISSKSRTHADLGELHHLLDVFVAAIELTLHDRRDCKTFYGVKPCRLKGIGQLQREIHIL